MKKLLLKSLFVLFLIAAAGIAKGQTHYFQENFSGAALPAGWTNDSAGQPGVHLWIFDNIFSRNITGAGFDANFAMFDSDENSFNDGTDENAALTTPSINISAAIGNLYLELDEQYRSLAGPNSTGSTHWIEASVDGGTTWSNIAYDSSDVGFPNPAVHSGYNLSSYVGNTNIKIRFHYTGSWDWWWAIDNVDVVSYPACSAAPNAGSAISSTGSLVCSGVNFTLSLTGADSGPLISYQWQSSPDNSNWSDIAGATNATATVNQGAATFYRCNVSCSTFTASSTSVSVTMNIPSLCYCDPVHVGSCSGGIGAITNFNITGTTLNQSSACDELSGAGYTFWPPAGVTTANLTRGTAYDFNVTTDDDNIISIWIDFNTDGIYDSSEWVQPAITSVAGVANTSNWTIPIGALVGPTGLRVRARAIGNTNDGTSACLGFGSGETEDYIIGIEFNVGINNLTHLNGVAIYPNPTTGKLSVFFDQIISGTTIQIFDVIGNMVNSTKVESSLRSDIDISDLSNGVYFAKVRNAQGTVTQKIILNK